ncbi:hypothetical protein P43SY_005753 [Pythium insidiosum]|uniref:Uncharacterized protein n=1 Tax=Pythium insidiosum TaxID=114742 RepID=A0AAD5MJ86_PYTIN|nr:hypothetical protein P43SY_005753 [Pythium insidiosum]
MSQCWSRCGSLYAVARDRVATVYSVDPATTTLTQLAEIPLRFAAAAMQIHTQDPVSSSHLLVVGTSAGILIHEVLPASPVALAQLLPDVAVSTLTLAPDASRLVVGTVDGRIFVLSVEVDAWRRGSCDVQFSTVLPSPRVTSVSWSQRHNRVIIATRKGTVHAFCPADGSWKADSKFDALATGASSPSQTLVAWWGPQSPIIAIAARDDPVLLEFHDVFSGRRTQSLRLAPKPQRQASAMAAPSDSDDRHLVGLCAVMEHDERLVCIDSTATLWVISWPFLSICCPR